LLRAARRRHTLCLPFSRVMAPLSLCVSYATREFVVAMLLLRDTMPLLFAVAASAATYILIRRAMSLITPLY